jgi:hypothetical protein
MEKNTMEQLMEFMKAQFSFLVAEMDADKAESKGTKSRKDIDRGGARGSP